MLNDTTEDTLFDICHGVYRRNATPIVQQVVETCAFLASSGKILHED